jgi:hypothetical protein
VASGAEPITDQTTIEMREGLDPKLKFLKSRRNQSFGGSDPGNENRGRGTNLAVQEEIPTEEDGRGGEI